MLTIHGYRPLELDRRPGAIVAESTLPAQMDDTTPIARRRPNSGVTGQIKRVMIVDDHVAFRRGVRNLLETRPKFTLVGEAANAAEAIGTARTGLPDIVILSYPVRGPNGFELSRALRQIRPALEFVMFTLHKRESLVVEVLREGIRGLVLKSDPEQHLLDALDTVALHHRYVSSNITQSAVHRAPGERTAREDVLTPREREVVELIASGKLNKQVASTLGVSIKTVETHRAKVMQKLELRTAADITRYAIRNGLVQDS